jgi:cell division protein FtsW
MSASKPSIRWPTLTRWPGRNENKSAGGVAGTIARGLQFTLSPVSLELDRVLLIVTLTLLGIGLLMVQSAQARIAAMPRDFLFHFFFNVSGLHVLLAVILMMVLWRMDYRRLLGRTLWTSPATILMGISIVCLALVLTHFGATINGARRWLMIRVGSHHVGFEPSELAKWVLIVFIAAYAAHRAETIRSFWRGFVPLIGVVGITTALILKEDFGTAALMVGIAGMMMLMAGCKWWHLAILIPPALAVAYFAVWNVPYRRERFLIFLHPHMDPQGAGYNPIQSLLSFSSGGFWGKGLGNGVQKMGYLPEDSTDFIFSLIAEELGFMGCLMVISLYITLVIVGWRIVHKAENIFTKLIAFGTTATIGLQAAMNVAVVTVTVPTKGIALPMISAGGTGWILTAGAVGLLMNVERSSRMAGGAMAGGTAELRQSQKDVSKAKVRGAA